MLVVSRFKFSYTVLRSKVLVCCSLPYLNLTLMATLFTNIEVLRQRITTTLISFINFTQL